MKPIIAFDLDGTIIKSAASDNAHKQWFSIMSQLLNDPTVAGLIEKKHYFPEVLFVMERYLGLSQTDLFQKSIIIKYARNLYQMLYLAELKKKGQNAFVPEILDILIDLKSQCRIALITTAPEDMVLPALDISGSKELFDFIYRRSLNQESSKLELLKKFVKEIGKPAIYIGNEKKDSEACKELGIKFGLAKWDKYDEDATANLNFSSPKQLKGILNVL